jgi:hypothetical protein
LYLPLISTMPSLYAEIDINAPRALVWQTLIRKDQWRWWNTFLYDCNPDRPIRQGAEVALALCRQEGDEFTDFEPRITLVQPERCLRWLAKMPGFKSEQVFELQDLGPNRTQYIHRERFQGALSTLFMPFIKQDERQGLQRMARQLKRYTERQVYLVNRGDVNRGDRSPYHPSGFPPPRGRFNS